MTDWTVIVHEHGPAVWRTLWRLLGNRADADECFQETFLTALQYSRDQGRGVLSWSGLLQRISTSRAMDRLRQRYRTSASFESLSDGGSVGDAVAAAPSHRPGPVEWAVASELSERLRRALCRLPQPQAEAFSLHALSGWSYEEIGRQTGMSSSAVGVNIHRARQRLGELLGDLKAGEASAEVGHD